MNVQCHACGQVQPVADDVFGNQDVLWLNCAACGQAMRIVSPTLRTLRMETTAQVASPVMAELNADGRELRLPEGQQLSLKVVEGEEKGTVFPVNKARMLIGRGNADITLNDLTASRLHCALEVSDQEVFLRDLGSSNGTLVNDQPIAVASLRDGSTFRVGMHVLQLVITPGPA
jgi:hypothetical protein